MPSARASARSCALASASRFIPARSSESGERNCSNWAPLSAYIRSRTVATAGLCNVVIIPTVLGRGCALSQVR